MQTRFGYDWLGLNTSERDKFFMLRNAHLGLHGYGVVLERHEHYQEMNLVKEKVQISTYGLTLGYWDWKVTESILSIESILVQQEFMSFFWKELILGIMVLFSTLFHHKWRGAFAKSKFLFKGN